MLTKFSTAYDMFIAFLVDYLDSPPIE